MHTQAGKALTTHTTLDTLGLTILPAGAYQYGHWMLGVVASMIGVYRRLLFAIGIGVHYTMNRWMRTGMCLAILLMVLIMAIKAIDATAAHVPALRDGRIVAEQVVFAGQPGSILPIGHSVGVDAVAFAPDGTLIASGNVDNLVRLWQTQTGKLWRTLTGHSSGVTSVAFSPDSTLVASGSWDGTVRLWRSRLVRRCGP